MSDQQLNATIVDFESQLFVNAPEFNTREEYAIFEAWTNTRKTIAKEFKALLVAGNIDDAETLYHLYTGA